MHALITVILVNFLHINSLRDTRDKLEGLRP